MFNTPYDTLAGKKTLEPDTVQKISNYVTLMKDSPESQLVKTKRTESTLTVYRLIPGGADIPAFSQPIYVENSNDTKCIVADIRPFVTVTSVKDQDYKVNNYFSYESILERLVLQTMWIEFGPNKLSGMGSFAMRAFSRWITNTIAKRLAISQDAQYNLSIIASYYYHCLHDDGNDTSYTQITMARVVGLIHTATGYEMRNIHDLISRLPIIRDVNGFITAVKESIHSPSLDNLNQAGLFALMGPTVTGHDPRATACIALEHPPTFVGLAYSALNYRGAGRSGLGEVIKPISKMQDAMNFTRAYSGLVSEFSK